ncbi:MAG: BrnT family toxin [Planctomycetes bacterium]|nr:BrnT family toxin [Planctomycetota bacterium]
MEFEWDPGKAAGNLRKHGVSFHEGASVLDDPLSLTYPDPAHSVGEGRYLTMGMSSRRRVLVVAHADRGDRIRIINARAATRKERRFHEEGNAI